MFLIAMKQMSQSRTPLIHTVIPIFDIITQALDDHVGDQTLPPAICMAAWRGRAMLNKYYGLTDESTVYCIAMCTWIFNNTLTLLISILLIVLHPRYKSSYFHKAGWPCSWITTTEELLHTEWNTNYKPQVSEPEHTSTVRSPTYFLCSDAH